MPWTANHIVTGIVPITSRIIAILAAVDMRLRTQTQATIHNHKEYRFYCLALTLTIPSF